MTLSASYPFHQFRQCDPQGVGDCLDVFQGKISLAPFNPTNVGAVELAGGPQAFLGISLFFPQVADSLPKLLQKVGSFLHASHLNIDNVCRSTDYK